MRKTRKKKNLWAAGRHPYEFPIRSEKNLIRVNVTSSILRNNLISVTSNILPSFFIRGCRPSSTGRITVLYNLTFSFTGICLPLMTLEIALHLLRADSTLTTYTYVLRALKGCMIEQRICIRFFVQIYGVLPVAYSGYRFLIFEDIPC